MPSVHQGGRRQPNHRSGRSTGSEPAASKGRFLFTLGAFVLLGVLAYAVLSERSGDASRQDLALSAETAVARGGPRAREMGERETGSALGRGWEGRGPGGNSRESIRRSLPRPRAAAESAEESVERLLQVRSADGSLTEQRAEEIRQTLRELAQRGEEGSGAIEELRRSLEDGEVDAFGDRIAGMDGSSASNGSDPQAGAGPPPEEVRPLLDRLGETNDPMEIAMLAQELEEVAPGAYRQEVLDAARQALQRAAQDPPEERVDVSPLFEVFEAYGGDQAAKDLEQDTKWWPYSLMALAGMPDGQGVPGLIATASDARIPVEQRPQLAFQMLAQAAAEYPQAGAALIDLAGSGQIPDRAWGPLASALEGMHLEFPNQLFGDGNQGIEGAAGSAPRLGGFENETLDVRYDLRLVSPTWSERQREQQLDLIDQLIEATGSTIAKESLNDARSSLLGGH